MVLFKIPEKASDDVLAWSPLSLFSSLGFFVKWTQSFNLSSLKVARFPELHVPYLWAGIEGCIGYMVGDVLAPTSEDRILCLKMSFFPLWLVILLSLSLFYLYMEKSLWKNKVLVGTLRERGLLTRSSFLCFLNLVKTLLWRSNYEEIILLGRKEKLSMLYADKPWRDKNCGSWATASRGGKCLFDMCMVSLSWTIYCPLWYLPRGLCFWGVFLNKMIFFCGEKKKKKVVTMWHDHSSLAHIRIHISMFRLHTQASAHITCTYRCG